VIGSGLVCGASFCGLSIVIHLNIIFKETLRLALLVLEQTAIVKEF
jgi:hypothetical protein